jgi:hypothetical protein
MNQLSTQKLIDKHNELVSCGEIDDIYSYRMEIAKRTNCMDWENNYKGLNLEPESHIVKVKQIEKPKIINKYTMEVVEVLKKCKIEDNIVYLPEGQLERKLYQDVAKSLDLIGGKWKGGKVMGFVFKEDPTELLSQISNGEKRNLKKEFQFFATPDKLADKLVVLAEIESHHLIGEPQAGQGAIVKAIQRVLSNKEVFCYELMQINRTFLQKMNNVTIVGDDFLFVDTDDIYVQKYDRIIANPPFSKNQDIDHTYQMYNMLKPEGRLVTITSKHWEHSTNKKETAFRNWLESVGAEVIEIENGAFKESGTTVGGKILVIQK